MLNPFNDIPLPPAGFIPLGEHLAATGQAEGVSVPAPPARFEPVASHTSTPAPPAGSEPLPTPESRTWMQRNVIDPLGRGWSATKAGGDVLGGEVGLFSPEEVAQGLVQN